MSAPFTVTFEAATDAQRDDRLALVITVLGGRPPIDVEHIPVKTGHKMMATFEADNPEERTALMVMATGMVEPHNPNVYRFGLVASEVEEAMKSLSVLAAPAKQGEVSSESCETED